MKKILMIIAFLFVLPISGQRNKGILYFKDGTKKIGLAKITSKKKIIFRKEKGSKKELYTYEDLDSVKITVKNWDYFITTTYCYKKTELNKYSLLKEIINGKLSLYEKIGINSGEDWTDMSTSDSGYYVWQKRDEIAVLLASYKHSDNLFSKKNKKAALRYFHDCPLLIKKIENNEFHTSISPFGNNINNEKIIKKLVNYYNENCE